MQMRTDSCTALSRASAKSILRLISSGAMAALVFMATAAGAQVRTGYNVRNLVSDIPGLAKRLDPNLVNPWGIVPGSSGIFWISNNGTGTSTLYDEQGRIQSLVVTIPASASNPDGANPTGIVFNSGPGFVVGENGASGPSAFIFVAEDGSISGWSPAVALDHAILASDDGEEGSVYKGAALGESSSGTRLFVANFHEGKISIYTDTFAEIDDDDAFVDPTIPAGFAPFNIQNINGLLYVAYAKQDAAKKDEVPGPGFGFVSVFDADGIFVKRLASHGGLNAPWGLALAPADFGELSGALLVGNFGDGLIHALDIDTGKVLGAVRRGGTPIQIEGLWGLYPQGNRVFFTAGINDEEHGLFGYIRANP